MKKMMLFKAAILCVVMMAFGLSLTACGDDETVTEVVANDRQTINMTYSVSLSDNWYKYFNIEVTYTGAGAVQSETLNMDWKMNFSIPAANEPDEYVFSVVAKPKAGVELDPEVESYELPVNISAEVSAVKADGSADDSYGFYKSDNGSKTLSAASMAEYIKEEHSIFSFSEKVEE